MNTKLTLTIEDTLIKEAKEYAKQQGRSLSDIIESYLKTITKDQTHGPKISPVASSLRGSFTIPSGFDYKQELSKRLSEKYLGK